MEAKANSGGTTTAEGVRKKSAARTWGGFPTFQALLDNGSPRQKAVAWTTGYLQFMYGDPPTITVEQASMIDKSVMWPDREEFDRYRATAKAYEQVHKTLKMALLYFREARERALGTYRLCKELEQTRDTLDGILRRMAGMKIAKEQLQTVKAMIAERADARKKDRAAMLKALQADVREAGECLEDLKGIATAIEDYAIHTRTKSLMPDFLRDALKEAKHDHVRETEPMFSAAELEARIARGDDTAGMDLAIFPSWEGTVRTEGLYDNWSHEIKGLVRDHIKLLK